MNAKKLARWKITELEKANAIIQEIENVQPLSIQRIYPEWEFNKDYTTSLDPKVPLWALVPFFSKVIVGITPYFRDEEAFCKWYGVSLRELFQLYEKKRVLIRVLFPSARSSIPSFMDPLFDGTFPSTARDRVFDECLIGQDRSKELKSRFASIVRRGTFDISIDGFTGHKGRAFKTAESVYLQLHAFGYGQHARAFEKMYNLDNNAAMKWLEMCRLLLIGPYHYSLLGIHSIPQDAISTVSNKQILQFPIELGRILVETLGLVGTEDYPGDFTLNDCLAVYPDFQLARETLLALDRAIKTGNKDVMVHSSEDLRQILFKAKKSLKRWLRLIRCIIACGAGVITAPFDGFTGILVGIGTGVAGELESERLDKRLSPLAHKIIDNRSAHLGLLLRLDESVRSHFKNK